jgi:hypothetical protein
VADPNQTPTRGDWACPCAGCAKAVAFERKQLLQLINEHKKEYLEYRGSSFDEEGNLLWAKDDALAYAEGLDKISLLIEDRIPKPVKRKV